MILKKTTFCKCWYSSVIYHLECNSRLWIVTHIWYMSLNFKIIMMSLWPEKNWPILFVPLDFVNVGYLDDFMILSAILDHELSLIWYMSLNFEIVMMPLWPERNWWILFVPLNFVNVGYLGDFMILSAILDHELSLIYDIWAWVLKLSWCLYDFKEIDGYYLSH